MQLLNILTIALLTSTTVVDSHGFMITNSEGEPIEIVYDDGSNNQIVSDMFTNTAPANAGDILFGDDTTCFDDADYVYPDQLTWFRFPQSDQFDYMRYTATYSRNVYLDAYSEDSVVNVNVYLESKGFDYPYRTYSTDEMIYPLDAVFVEQGDTVYFQIWCDLPCQYNTILKLDENPSGIACMSVSKLHNYSIPHIGPATIYYSFHSSVRENVEGQSFTYSTALREAMDIWESCGNVTFVEDALRATCKIKTESNIDFPSMEFSHNPITNNYYAYECIIPKDESFYYTLYDDVTVVYDNRPVTPYEAVLGVSVCLMGAYIGLGVIGTNDYAHNMMSANFRAYVALGDGDTNSFMYLWGDANENV